MFQYSFSTVFMAILASNLLIIVITLLFRSNKIMANAGYKLLALFIGFTVLRFLLPFEFPFTITILLPESISQVIVWIRHPFYELSGIEISVWRIFESIWLIGFLIGLARYIRSHIKARYYILSNSLDATTAEPYRSLLDQICRERNKKNRFKVLTTTGINKPMLYGIFFPRILIPETMQMTRDELYYSLVHEASHHFHLDLLIKKIIKLISLVYWWNPFCHVLNRKVDVILEMRVDNVLTASNRQAIIDYLHNLYNIGERITAENVLSKSLTMSILSDSDGDLTKRHYMLLSTGQKKNRTLNVILFTLVITVYVASHLFILEPHYASPSMVEETFEQTTENTYAILKEDGTYDIYLLGRFIENTDSLEFFSSDIPIYTEKEITNEEH